MVAETGLISTIQGPSPHARSLKHAIKETREKSPTGSQDCERASRVHRAVGDSGPVGPDNDSWLRTTLAAARNTGGPIVAAWGTDVRTDRIVTVLALPDLTPLSALTVTTRDSHDTRCTYEPTSHHSPGVRRTERPLSPDEFAACVWR